MLPPVGLLTTQIVLVPFYCYPSYIFDIVIYNTYFRYIICWGFFLHKVDVLTIHVCCHIAKLLVTGGVAALVHVLSGVLMRRRPSVSLFSNQSWSYFLLPTLILHPLKPGGLLSLPFSLSQSVSVFLCPSLSSSLLSLNLSLSLHCFFLPPAAAVGGGDPVRGARSAVSFRRGGLRPGRPAVWRAAPRLAGPGGPLRPRRPRGQARASESRVEEDKCKQILLKLCVACLFLFFTRGWAKKAIVFYMPSNIEKTCSVCNLKLDGESFGGNDRSASIPRRQFFSQYLARNADFSKIWLKTKPCSLWLMFVFCARQLHLHLKP